jgi:hypothetical protein
VQFTELVGKPGRQLFSEAHRLLTSRGIVEGTTGTNVPTDQLQAALKAVGFQKILMYESLNGGIFFRGVKP